MISKLFFISFCMFSIACFCVGSLQAAELQQRVTNGTAVANAPVIISIVPAQAEPGARVSISGSGFGNRISTVLGNAEIPAQITDNGKRIEFIVPLQIEPGTHLLYLKRSDGVTGRPYNFTILPLRPVLLSLNPDRISSCSQRGEREVTVQGRNFNNSSMLFFDGAGIKNSFLSTESLRFIVPEVSGGLHQIQVRNSPENASVTLALTVETRAEIDQVSIGSENVNYYELEITGRNFHQNSTIFIDGQRIGTGGGGGGQSTSTIFVDGQRVSGGGSSTSDRDRLIYVNCNKLIYQRYPYSSTNKEFRIQVVNPGGEGSQIIQVNAP